MARRWRHRFGRSRAPQDRADARNQLAQFERLGKVVVGAELEPDHPVDGVALAGQHDDRDVALLADVARQVETVFLAEIEIERDERDLAAARRQARSSAPSLASETAKPSPSRHRRSRVRTFGSSSTTRMWAPLHQAATQWRKAFMFARLFDSVDGSQTQTRPVVAWLAEEGHVLGEPVMSQNSGQTASPAAQAAKLRGILELAVTAIITIDDRGLIESINPATERLFGYGAAELIGQNVKVLMPEPYRGGARRLHRQLSSAPASKRSSASAER